RGGAIVHAVVGVHLIAAPRTSEKPDPLATSFRSSACVVARWLPAPGYGIPGGAAVGGACGASPQGRLTELSATAGPGEPASPARHPRSEQEQGGCIFNRRERVHLQPALTRAEI